MYKMSYYSEQNADKVLTFMQEHPFAILTANGYTHPIATHIPFLIDKVGDDIVLRGHIMRNTDHHIALMNNPEALVVFNGAHCYISSSWYSNKGEGATWNYMTVHAKGTVAFTSEEETITILQELTDKYEAEQPTPQLMKDIPQDYIEKYVKAIVGIKIVVKEIDNTFKLSQNKDEKSYKNIVNQLESIGKPEELAIAEEMRQRKPELF